MSDFAAQWISAKKAAFKRPMPPELNMALNQGNNLGPALKAFDAANTHEKRAKAVVAVLKAKDVYVKDLNHALKVARSSEEKKTVQWFTNELLTIWRGVEQAAQPVRPSGSMKQFEVVRAFNLAAGFKPKFLSIKATEVTAYIEIDEVLDKLIKDGKESLKLQHFGEVAKAELEKVAPLFAQTMSDIEKKIEKDMSLLESKSKEANEVLKHYAKVVEARVNKVISDEWAKYLARAKHLSDFKFKTGVKITLGVIGVGVAAASLALSFGTAWMSIFAIAKGVSELMQNVASLTQGIDKTTNNLMANLKDVDKLNKQREDARKKGESQKGSKSKEAAKEVLNSLLPISKLMLKSCSTIETEAKQLLGQVSKLEESADNAVGAMNKALKEINNLPTKGLSAAQSAQVKKMATAMEDFFKKISTLHKDAQAYAAIGERALTAAQKLKQSDQWSAGLTATSSGIGTKGTAVYAAANFAYQCANAGKSLIPI
jgi:hypothetical protein